MDRLYNNNNNKLITSINVLQAANLSSISGSFEVILYFQTISTVITRKQINFFLILKCVPERVHVYTGLEFRYVELLGRKNCWGLQVKCFSSHTRMYYL